MAAPPKNASKLDSLPEPLAKEVETWLARASDTHTPDAAAIAATEALCDRLFQAEAWPALHAVAEKALESVAEEASPRMARFLVRAAEGLGDVDALTRALAFGHERLPKDAALALRYAQALENEGDLESALGVVGHALDALVKGGDAKALDEALVKLLEAKEPQRIGVAMHTLGTLVRRGEVERIVPFLDLAGDVLLDPVVSEKAWTELARAGRELDEKDAERLRPVLVRIARARLGAHAPLLLASSGMEPSAAPIAGALAKLEDLARRAPGTYHDHGSWGVGRVTALEADAVTLDFPKRSGQRISLAAAKSALQPVPATDVRVLVAWQPDELEKIRSSDPVDLVARLLKTLAREATTTEIKKLLIAWGAVPSAKWTSFWNSAKKKLTEDARIDASHAFEQRYALAREGQGVRLPEFPRHDPPRKALAVLKRLLSQHAGARAALARTWGPGLDRWIESKRTSMADRVAALCWLTDIQPDPDRDLARGVALLAEAFHGEFEFGELPSPIEQRKALDWALRGPSWEKAARSALASRLGDVREAAFQAIEERHGKDAPAFFEKLWLDATVAPSALLSTIEQLDPAKHPVPSLLAASPWSALRGICNLLETAPEEPVVARAQALLAPDGFLAELAKKHPAGEDVETLLTRRALTWKTTERNLEPMLAFAAATGLSALTARVEEERRARLRGKAAKPADTTAGAQAYSGKNYMTRRVYERTRQELVDLEAALKTTIPQAIQKARELGDLRENAEYHSAKLKQSQAEARVLLLVERLREVELIDDLVPDAGVAAPGTAVTVLLVGGGTVTYWILGEGDNELGPDVVSYRAPIGLALLGKRAGEAVSWLAEGLEVRGKVVAVEARPPR
jgi:transcription elongation factor GreA